MWNSRPHVQSSYRQTKLHAARIGTNCIFTLFAMARSSPKRSRSSVVRVACRRIPGQGPGARRSVSR
jgi:hypothetical protein